MSSGRRARPTACYSWPTAKFTRMARPAPCSAIPSSSPPRSTSCWAAAGCCPRKYRYDALVDGPPGGCSADRRLRRRARPIRCPARPGCQVSAGGRTLQRPGGRLRAGGPWRCAPDASTVDSVTRHPGWPGGRRCHPPPRHRGRRARLLTDLLPDHCRWICDGPELWLRERRPHPAALRRAHSRPWPLVAVSDAGRRLGGYGFGVPRAPEPAIQITIRYRAAVLLRRCRGHRLRPLARSLGVAAAARPGVVLAELGARAWNQRSGPPLRRLLPLDLACLRLLPGGRQHRADRAPRPGR